MDSSRESKVPAIRGDAAVPVRSVPLPDQLHGGHEMAQLMRKCSQCGTVDTRNAWSSPADAAKDGAFEGKWSCASCAWTEFDLVESDADVQQPQSAATR